MLCEYKDVFGKVKEGVHSYRLGGFAIVDVISTILVACILKYIFPKTSLLLWTGFLFLLGIILHRLFCVRTTIDRVLFP